MRVMTFIVWLGFLSLFILKPTFSYAGSPVLILPFENATKDKEYDGLEKGIPALLTAYLSPYSDAITLIDRDQLEAIAHETALHKEGLTNPADMKKLGKVLQAKFILRGSFTNQGNGIQSRAFLYETDTARLVKSFETESNKSHLTLLCQKMAGEVAAFFQTELKPLAELPPETDPEVNLHMIYGLGYFYSGQFHKAFPEFMKILERNPDHALAKFWLGKCFFGAGLKDHAQIEADQFVKKYPQHPKVLEAKQILASIEDGKRNK